MKNIINGLCSKARMDSIHNRAINFMESLPDGKKLIEPYLELRSNRKVLFGLFYPLILEDWFVSGWEKSFLDEIYARITCMYALIIDLDNRQDKQNKKEIVFDSKNFDGVSIRYLQKAINGQLPEERHVNLWQDQVIAKMYEVFNLVANDKNCRSLEKDQISFFKKRFAGHLINAVLNFVQETKEVKQFGRRAEKLKISAGKNELVLGFASLLGLLMTKENAEIVHTVSYRLLLPFQIVDDLNDWWEDYELNQRTPLLSGVEYGLSHDELYGKLVMNGDFETMMDIVSKELAEAEGLLLSKGKKHKKLFEVVKDLQKQNNEQRESILRFKNFVNTKMKGGGKK